MLKKLFYFLIPIILFTTNVYAETLTIPRQYIQVNNSTWYNSYGYYGLTVTTSGTSFPIAWACQDYQHAPTDPDRIEAREYCAKFSTIIADVCIGSGVNSITRTSGYGTCTNQGCYGQNLTYNSLNMSCKYNDNSSGFLYRIYLPISQIAYNEYNTSGQITDNITIKVNGYNTTATFTNFYLSTELVDINNESSLEIINNQISAQTNAINNQTSAINNQTSAINNQTNSINNQTNLINDDSLPNTSNFLDDWTDLLLENNTINQILYLPVNVLTNIKSAFNGSCNNYTMPFGLTGGNEILTFNCWTISDYLGSEITGLISGFIGFYMIYYFALFLWKFYDDFTSMKDTLSIILENPDGPLQKGEIE